MSKIKVACYFLGHGVESLAYLSLHVWVYFHSNLCSGLQKTHLFCTREQHSAFLPYRVIKGRWFSYQSKARMRLPISPLLWLWSYLAPFLRYGDLLATKYKLPIFSYPSLIRRPRSSCSLWNFAVNLSTRKLESLGYPPVKTPWS